MRNLDPERLGVYVVTSDAFGRTHEEVALAALAGGASAVQLRGKDVDDDRLVPLAAGLSARCRAVGALFIVNDRVEVALAVVAEGVHVGQTDALEGVRERIGPTMILGVSVDDADQARRAEAAGADYLGVTVWSTPTKRDARPRGLEGVRAVAEASALPVVGIGGIDASNAADVLAAGAVGVAVISAVAAAEDPAAATRALVEVVARWRAGER